MIIIILHLFLATTLSITPSCNSTCQDYNCDYTSPTDCTVCHPELYIDGLTYECTEIPAYSKFVDFITDTWVAGSSEITKVQYNGVNYTDVSAFWNTTGLILYDTPDSSAMVPQSTNFIIFLQNLPPHFQLRVSHTALLSTTNDPNLNCLTCFVNTDLGSGWTYADVLNSFSMVLTKAFTNHTLTTQSVIITYGGTSMGFPGSGENCPYVIIKEIGIILSLCPYGCTYCPQPDVCTTCKFDTVINKQLYFDQVLTACIDTCTSNYYYQAGPPQKFICNKCHAACKTCTVMNSAAGCTTCNQASGYYLQLNSAYCGYACPSGQIVSTTSPKTCILCSSNCFKCIYTPTNCSMCGLDSNGIQMYLSPKPVCTATCAQRYCVITCPPKSYPYTLSKECRACHTSCLTCTGSNNNNCLTCDIIAGQQYYLNSNNSTCTATCTLNYYNGPSSTFICNQCHTACLSCSVASSNTGCLTCNEASGYHLAFGSTTNCVATCTSTQFVGGSPKICMNCDSNCLTCITSATNCLTCGLSGGSQMYLTPTATCSLTCPSKYYPNTTTKTCLGCHSSCLTCSGPLSTDCLSCDVSGGQQLYFDLSSNTCILSCSQSYYSSGITHICNQCDTGCLSCNAVSSNTACTACNEANGYNLAVGSTNNCIRGCPSGQFVSGNPKICSSCDSNCATCVTSATNCLSCGLSGGLQMYLTPTATCQINCPSKYYPDTTTKTCLACDATCLTCSGPLSTNCLTCDLSGRQQLFLDITTRTCGSTCSQNYYSGTGVYICNQCDVSCASCTATNSNTDCVACNQAAGYNLAMRTTTECILGCPTGQYVTGNPLICDSCDTNCYTCVSSSINCLSCGVSRSGQMYLTPYATCSNLCPQYYYPDTITNTCLQCHSTCLTCNGILATNCLTCDQTGAQPLYIDPSNNTCTLTCSVNYYSDGVIFQCDRCHISCLTCTTSNSATACTACNQPLNYNLVMGSTSLCSLGCPVGQFVTVTTPKICQACSSNCRTCAYSPTNCTSCDFSAIGGQMYLLKNGTCVYLCPSTTYIDTVNNKCIDCHAWCLSCWGGLNTQCNRCNNITNSSNQVTIYYLISGSSTCSQTCPDLQYIDSRVPNYCQLCSSSCLTCAGNSTTCLTCQTGNYFYNNTCIPTCPTSTYPNIMASICASCDAACLACTGSGANSCQSCKSPYLLSFGTTSCISQCPNGQYSNSTANGCLLCSSICHTCINASTICTTCSVASSLIPVYFYNNTCLQNCPRQYYGNDSNITNRICSLCAVQCLSCSNSPTNCFTCNNVTANSTTTVYYKDAILNTCGLSCGTMQFISQTIPNTCANCSSACTQCSLNASYCQKCATGFYLHIPTTQCLAICPASFYNNPTFNSTVDSYICSPCASQCRICTNPTVSSCSACSNITDNQGITTYYFKQPNITLCASTCPTGYLANQGNNTCLACQNGCVACSVSIGICSACTIYAGVVYYLDRTTNSCATICPNGGSGNTTDYVCYLCQYFTFNQKCIQSCPTGYVGVIGNISTCVECSSTNVSCNKILGFTVSTKMVNQGKSFEHKVNLPQGLSSTCTPASLTPGLAVSLISPAKGRLLIQVVPLTVQSLSISANGDYILIWTNSVAGDLSTSNISVSFRAGALISSNGIPYNQLAADLSLDNPTFMYSYIQTFSSSTSIQAQGIVFVLLSFILLLTSLITTKDQPLINDCMALIQLIQIYGLSRIRPFPFDLDFFNFLTGFSHYELDFIPNVFKNAFPTEYSQSSINSLAFSIGTQNLILNYGSIIIVFICLQTILFIVLYFVRNNQHYLLKYKLFQQNFIVLWSIILLFGSTICLLSTEINKVSSQNLQYSFSVLAALVIFVSYSMYFAFWVFRSLKTDLFKVNSLFRLLGIIFLIYGQKFALMYINLQEIFFFVLDLTLYRETMGSKVLLSVEKMTSLVILNLTFLSVAYSPLLIASAVCFSVLAMINMVLLFKSIFSSLNLSIEGDHLPKQSITQSKIQIQKKEEIFGSEMSSKSELQGMQGQYSSFNYRSNQELPVIELLHSNSQSVIFQEPTKTEQPEQRDNRAVKETIVEEIQHQDYMFDLRAPARSRNRNRKILLQKVQTEPVQVVGQLHVQVIELAHDIQQESVYEQKKRPNFELQISDELSEQVWN